MARGVFARSREPRVKNYRWDQRVVVLQADNLEWREVTRTYLDLGTRAVGQCRPTATKELEAKEKCRAVFLVRARRKKQESTRVNERGDEAVTEAAIPIAKVYCFTLCRVIV